MTKTRFMGVGNPSERGVHLLYYFRQENGLQKHNFMDNAQIFSGSGGARHVTDTNIERYVFLDDVCGSGDTACVYSRNFLRGAKSGETRRPDSIPLHIRYRSWIEKRASEHSLRKDAKAIFELDASYRCVSPESRYFKIYPAQIEEAHLTKVALSYGQLVAPGDAGEFNDGQLLLGFSHNIPDNTLPIIWRDPTNGSPIPWTAALRRYMKV